jgi:3-oxoadipate enol-lactonase
MSVPYRLATDGITVNVRVDGAGPPLLFLGGSNFDLSIRAPVFQSDLINHFTVAAADPRGLGQTDQPNGEWSMLDYAQDALNLLDALKWERVDVLGESFGAMTALHLAALAPDRINRIALSAGAAGGAGGQSFPIHTLRQIDDAQLRARAALEIMDDRFADQVARDPQHSDDLIATRVATEAAFLASHDNATGYPRLLRARAKHDAWHVLPKITAPVLVLAGKYDQQAPLDRAENMARALPNASLHIIGGGHSICFAHPEPVATLLKNWT